MTAPITEHVARVACHLCGAYDKHSPDCRILQRDDLLDAAYGWRRIIWDSGDYVDEDERIGVLNRICLRLCGGDEAGAAELATRAVWRP